MAASARLLLRSSAGQERLRHRHTARVSTGAAEADVKRDPFIYVYELPTKYKLKYNVSVQELPVGWHSDQYDYDVKLHEYLLTSPQRQMDPEKASLFFVPVHLARLFSWSWTRGECEDPDDDGLLCITPMSKLEHRWDGAQRATSHVVRGAFRHVSQAYPYWNRSNGADHFLVYSYDRGRCDMAAHLTPEDMGQSFAIMSYGDLAARSIETPSYHRAPNLDGLGYNWSGPLGFHCVRPDDDIIVPMYSEYGREHLVSPFDGERNISALLRFCAACDDKELVANHGHRLRHELVDSWRKDPLPGSDQGVQGRWETELDMRSSVFCVCPPGNTQDSTRVWRAMVNGCIPVTYLRAVELPFMRRLGIDYAEFSINIQPDDYSTTQARLRRVLARPERLRALQEGVLHNQKHFLWGPDAQGGVYDSIVRELAMRAAQLASGDPLSVF